MSGDEPETIWKNQDFSAAQALAVGQNAVLVAGKRVSEKVSEETTEESAVTYRLSALSLEDGKLLWSHRLPAEPVAWGLAIDHAGRMIVTMNNGEVLCFSPKA